MKEGDHEPPKGTIVPLSMFNLLKKPYHNEGVVHVRFDLHWLKHVCATTIDHEFTLDWGRKMEELVILVGSI